MSVSGNNVIIPAGTFLVSYGGTGTPVDGTVMGVELYVNGVALTNSELTNYATTTVAGSVSKTLLITEAAAGTLAIHNPTATTVNYDNAFITVSRLTT